MSLFKKDDALLNGSVKEASGFTVLKTGGEVDAILSALLPHSHDKEPAVRTAYDFALVDLGNRQPALTLSSLVAFLHRNPSLPPPHRIQLLCAVDKVVAMQREHLSPTLADDLIRFLTREMIKDAEPINELAQPCSAALVSLSVPFCPPLLTELLSHFKHGDLPHYYLVKTLSDVAVANPTSFTLRLSDTLTRTTPCLSMVKKPPLRWVFATALGHYADALHHFTCNATDEERASAAIHPQSFELEFLSSYDILFNRWLADSGEVKVRMAIVEALGSMSQVLQREALEQRLPKVIGKCLEMYKKEKATDHLPISQGLYAMVAEACKTKAIEPLLPLLLSSLHPLLCRPIDPSSPLSFKNHNEQLRIVEAMARADLDVTLAFIVGRFQLKERDVRIGSLIILRHLVNAMDPLMVDKRPLVMSAVLTMVGEQDLQVKKAIMQLIVSMSNQGYLAMEGGQALIKFILQQCALPVDETAAGKGGAAAAAAAGSDEASPLQIRNAGVHMVYVMATKVPSSRPVMWPYLLELLNDDAYNRAILVLLRCIDALATRAREENAADYQVDFALRQDIPRPQAILARLLSLLAEPYRKDIGGVVCRVMLALGPIIHPDIGAYWDEAVPALLDYLEQPQGEAGVWKWQDAVLKLWKETVNRISEQKWLQDTIDALLAQFRLYQLRPAKPDQPPQHDSTIHRQIHRYLGYTLSRVEARSMVERCIDSMLATVNHRVDSERVGFAQGMGLCAYTHIDLVLGRLSERVGRKEKKVGFFANLLKDDEGIGDELQLSTLVLSYGYVAAYAQPELLLSRIDVYILHNLLPLMPKARTHLFRITATTALDLLGKAVVAERLPEGKKNFRLTQRDDVIGQLLTYLDERARKDVRVSGEMRAYGLSAMSTLLHLQPPISAELRSKLLLAVLPYFALTEAQLADENRDKRKEDEGLETREKREEPTTASIQENLNGLLATLVRCDPQLPTVLDALKLLEAYLVSVRVVERQRASASFLVLLKEFVRDCVREEGRVKREEKGVPLLGLYVSMVLPRVLDSDVEVRGGSVENVQALLYVHQLLHSPEQPKPSAEVKLLSECRAKVERPAMAERMEGADDLAGVLVNLLPVAEASRCLSGLFTAFIDADADAALGAAFFWQRLIQLRGNALASELQMLVGGELLSSKQVKASAVLQHVHIGLRQLAALHFNPVVAQLLDTHVPLSKEHVDAYAALVAEPSTPLPLQVIEHLCALLNDTPIDRDKPAPIVATSTAALRDIFRVDSLRPLLQSHLAPVASTLLMRIGMCNDIDPAGTADAVAALRAFFAGTGDTAVVAELDAADVWKGLASPHYDDAITVVCRSLCSHHPTELKPALLAYLAKFFSQQSYTGQRIVATAMLAELVSHSSDNGALLRDVIKALLPRVADKVCKVRKQALRGLGNLVGVWNDETADMATSILSSLISASEDGDAEVAGEAVASLTRIVGVVSEGTVAPMLISICFRLRPAFERKEENVRASAFTLFAALCRFGRGGGGTEGGEGGGPVGSADFLEHVHTNLPIFILHLLDESAAVRHACQAGLKAVAGLLDPAFAALVGESACEAAGYDELVYRAAPVLAGVYPQHVRGYIDTSVAYFGSKWVELRGAAALLSCCLLANASEAVRKSITVSALVTQLLKLLEEPNANVRAKAVKGLAYLHDV